MTIDRYEAFTRKQGKTENLEQYHYLLTELVVKGNFKCPNCNDGRLETDIIRDLFTANMSNDEVQKDLLAETKTAEQALDYAIRREKGLENQLVIRKQGSPTSTQVSNVKTEPVGFVQKRGNNINLYPTRGDADAIRNNNNKGGTLNDNQQNKRHNALNVVIFLAWGISKNVRPRTKSEIIVTNVDTTRDYANHLT